MSSLKSRGRWPSLSSNAALFAAAQTWSRNPANTARRNNIVQSAFSWINSESVDYEGAKYLCSGVWRIEKSHENVEMTLI